MDNNPNDNLQFETLDENTLQTVPEQPSVVAQETVVQGTTEPVIEANQPVQEVEQPVKQKKKINQTLIIVIVAGVVLAVVALLLSQGAKGGNVYQDEEEKEQEIKVKTGTDWGNKYLTYMLKNKPNLETYEISFLDVDDNGVPEMFLRYIDNTDIVTLKILYIEDDDVYETKYYHDYRIRYIYSLKDKTTSWYLFMTTTKHYGTYTMISKIIDKMAFDSDIKATNDQELIQYGKAYYDTDYELTFYNIKKDNHENDYKNFIKKYDSYVEKMDEVRSKVEEKYKDYEYSEDKPVVLDSVSISGRIYKYGNYYAQIPANENEDIIEHTEVIVLNDDGTIILRGVLYKYSISNKGDTIELKTDTGMTYALGLTSSGVFSCDGLSFVYKE